VDEVDVDDVDEVLVELEEVLSATLIERV